MLDKLRIDPNRDFWHQPFWEPILAGIALAGLGICLFALIAGLIDSSKNNIEDVFRNEPEGFRSYKWGTKYDDIEGLEIPEYRAREFKLPKYHAIEKNENLEYEGIAVPEIIYFFDDHLLKAVMIDIPNEDSFELIKKILFKKYGQSEENDSQTYEWVGDTTKISLDGDRLYFGSVSSKMRPKIDADLEQIPYEIDFMQLKIWKNKEYICTIAQSDGPYMEESTFYNVYLCKLFEYAAKATRPVVEEINNKGKVNPEYLYLSVFIESNEGREIFVKLYEKIMIGLFSSLEECQKIYEYGLEHNIPIRQCKSWKSYLECRNNK